MKNELFAKALQSVTQSINDVFDMLNVNIVEIKENISNITGEIKEISTTIKEIPKIKEELKEVKKELEEIKKSNVEKIEPKKEVKKNKEVKKVDAKKDFEIPACSQNGFMIESNELKKVLDLVSNNRKVAGKNEFLNNVLIEVEGDTLKFIHNNFVNVVEYKLNSTVWGKHKHYVIEFDKLSNMINKNDLVVFNVKDNKIKVNNQISEIILKINEFEIKESTKYYIDNEFEKICSLDFNEFKKSVNDVRKSISTDNTKPVLTTVCLSKVNDFLELTGIDGYRLHTSKIPCNMNNIEGYLLLTTETIKNIEKIKKDGVIEIFNNESYYKIIIDDIIIHSKKIDGEFIDYKKLFPKEETLNIVNIDKKELKQILSTILPSVKKLKHKLITLSFYNNILTINSKDGGGNISQTSTIPYIGSLKDYSISFNCQYLLEAIENINNLKICISEENINPVVIVGENQRNLVLPVRTNY